MSEIYPEPEGYRVALGFVKSNPANNRAYVELWKDDPWYSVIEKTYDRLNTIIPGYNISQIKVKFGGLRFYVGYPIDADSTAIKLAVEAIRFAETWVDGFEAGRAHQRGRDSQI